MVYSKIFSNPSNKKNSQNIYDKSIRIRKIIKILIPPSILLFFTIIFFWPSLLILSKNNQLQDQKNIIKTSEKDLKNFSFQGIDKFEQPFYLHAKKYQMIGNDKKKIYFEKPKAEINLKNGKWITLIAKKGVFDIEKKKLELLENVLVLHSDGEQINTDKAVLDLENGKFYGNKKLFGNSETIKFTSEGFEVEKTGKNFSLFGKSKIKIKKK